MRKLLLPAAGVALAALSYAAVTAQDTPKSRVSKAPSGDQAAMSEQCAKACDDCKRECDRCGNHCAEMVAQGHKEHLKTLRTCQDCATHCGAASCIVARRGPFSDLICTACADACKRCGDACEEHASHDAEMKRCGEECRKCEKACRDMLKHVASPK